MHQLSREAKPTERNKAALVHPMREDPSDSEDGDDSNGGEKDGVRGHIVVFNCPDSGGESGVALRAIVGIIARS